MTALEYALSMCILQSLLSLQKFWMADYESHKDYKRYQNNRITQFEQSRQEIQKFWKCMGFNKFKTWENVAFWTCWTLPLGMYNFWNISKKIWALVWARIPAFTFFGRNQSFIIPHQVQFWFWCPICHPNPLGFQIHL